MVEPTALPASRRQLLVASHQQPGRSELETLLALLEYLGLPAAWVAPELESMRPATPRRVVAQLAALELKTSVSRALWERSSWVAEPQGAWAALRAWQPVRKAQQPLDVKAQAEE